MSALARSAAKTSTYAVTHFLVAACVTFVVTGDWRAALAVGLIEPAVQTVAYVVHERAWDRRVRSETALAAPPAARVLSH